MKIRIILTLSLSILLHWNHSFSLSIITIEVKSADEEAQSVVRRIVENPIIQEEFGLKLSFTMIPNAKRTTFFNTVLRILADDHSAIASKVKLLDFSHNALTEAPFCQGFEEIIAIDLSFNNLKEILAFSYMPTMQALNLSRNKLKRLSSLSELPQLKALNLDFNLLQQPPILAKHTNLEALYIRSNPLRCMPDIGKWPNLQTLMIEVKPHFLRTLLKKRLQLVVPQHLIAQLTIDGLHRNQIVDESGRPVIVETWHDKAQRLQEQKALEETLAFKELCKTIPTIAELNAFITETLRTNPDITSDTISEIIILMQQRFIQISNETSPHHQFNGISKAMVLQWINAHLYTMRDHQHTTIPILPKLREVLDIETVTQDDQKTLENDPMFITIFGLSMAKHPRENPFNRQPIHKLMTLVNSWRKWKAKEYSVEAFDQALRNGDPIASEAFTVQKSDAACFLHERGLTNTQIKTIMDLHSEDYIEVNELLDDMNNYQ